MVEGTVKNKNSLISRGRDWLPLHFGYLNTPSRAEPSHRDMIYRPINPLARISVYVMCSGPRLWLGYLRVVCPWGYVGWKCDVVHMTKSDGGDNLGALFGDAICGLLQFRLIHCYPRILYIGSSLLFGPLGTPVLSIHRVRIGVG